MLYRSKHNDIATVKFVLIELQENNLDISHLVPAAEPSSEGGSPLIEIGAGNGMQPSAILHVLDN